MEPAMTRTFISFGVRPASPWNRVLRQLFEWRRRAYSRNELENLSDRTLRDIGLTRCEAHREATKPFWMA